MLRINRKHAWTWAHMIVSFAVFAIVLFSSFYVEVQAHGAYTSAMPWYTKVLYSADFLTAVNTAFPTMALFPVYSFAHYVFGVALADGGLVYVLALALDFVLWANVFLYALQLILFVPSWGFNWLYNNDKDERSR